ncbi:phosphatase PAP2 family protein [Sphingosinicella sp. LHD-64]|uniref:phosphatase PAP2 family protein n=1 Tax=Sphingosinicella sp. LHD-64 TaxID=3072139 RepID=UPI00280D18C1|nr:phosphatase PAP2 family protein [Sphingosinicella sp. LHD-64]MDQ8755822.1 phosphatase PAP2 family protein [Sphingosinicella sp. LHD-64]
MTDRREAHAAGLGIATVAIYMALVLATGRVDPTDFGRLFLTYLKGSFGLWLVIGLLGLVWKLYQNRPRSGPAPSPFAVMLAWGRTRWARDHGISFFWPPLLFASLMASFNAFKQMVLPLAGFRFDPLFAAMDRTLFLGHDPWRVTHALLSSPAATGLINAAYHGWFVPMALGVMICAWLPDSSYRLRTQYLLSYIAMWIGVGSVLAFLLPAAGPCFYSHFVGPAPEFQALMNRLAADQATLGAPLSALTFQNGLLDSFGSDTLRVGGGISAMPSVHNGLAALFAFAAFRLNRWAGWTMTAFAALIWIGSIHLGWHYAIDGIVSIALAWGIWTVAGRIAERLERQPKPMEAAAAIA